MNLNEEEGVSHENEKAPLETTVLNGDEDGRPEVVRKIDNPEMENEVSPGKGSSNKSA